MFAELITVNGIHDDPGEPVRPAAALRHGLLRKLSKGVAILLGGLGRDLQRTFGFRVVRRQQNPPVGLHGKNAVAGLEPEAVGHVLGKSGADGSARLSQGHFLGHIQRVA